MSKTAKSLYGYNFSWRDLQAAHAVEHSDTGTEKRCVGCCICVGGNGDCCFFAESAVFGV